MQKPPPACEAENGSIPFISSLGQLPCGFAILDSFRYSGICTGHSFDLSLHHCRFFSSLICSHLVTHGFHCIGNFHSLLRNAAYSSYICFFHRILDGFAPFLDFAYHRDYSFFGLTVDLSGLLAGLAGNNLNLIHSFRCAFSNILAQAPYPA